MNEEEAQNAVIATENAVWEALPEIMKTVGGIDKQTAAIITNITYSVLIARGELVRPGDSPEASADLAKSAKEQMEFIKLMEDLL